MLRSLLTKVMPKKNALVERTRNKIIPKAQTMQKVPNFENPPICNLQSAHSKSRGQYHMITSLCLFLGHSLCAGGATAGRSRHYSIFHSGCWEAMGGVVCCFSNLYSSSSLSSCFFFVCSKLPIIIILHYFVPFLFFKKKTYPFPPL